MAITVRKLQELRQILDENRQEGEFYQIPIELIELPSAQEIQQTVEENQRRLDEFMIGLYTGI